VNARDRLRGLAQGAVALAALAAILGLINHGVNAGGVVPWVVGPLMTVLGVVELGLGAFRIARPQWRMQPWAGDYRVLAFILAPPIPAPRRGQWLTERIAGGIQLLLGILFLAIGVYELGIAV